MEECEGATLSPSEQASVDAAVGAMRASAIRNHAGSGGQPQHLWVALALRAHCSG